MDFSSRSKNPYFIRAIYQWIVDGGATPYIKINLNYPGVRVPEFLRRDKQGKPASFVILNVAMRATSNLSMENEEITFSTRFSQASHNIVIPTGAVMAIYAQETGDGMAFPDAMAWQPPVMEGPKAISSATPDHESTTPTNNTPAPTEPTKRGHLKVVK